jgi:hypothetical protein
MAWPDKEVVGNRNYNCNYNRNYSAAAKPAPESGAVWRGLIKKGVGSTI